MLTKICINKKRPIARIGRTNTIVMPGLAIRAVAKVNEIVFCSAATSIFFTYQLISVFLSAV